MRQTDIGSPSIHNQRADRWKRCCWRCCDGSVWLLLDFLLCPIREKWPKSNHAMFLNFHHFSTRLSMHASTDVPNEAWVDKPHTFYWLPRVLLLHNLAFVHRIRIFKTISALLCQGWMLFYAVPLRGHMSPPLIHQMHAVPPLRGAWRVTDVNWMLMGSSKDSLPCRSWSCLWWELSPACSTSSIWSIPGCLLSVTITICRSGSLNHQQQALVI